MPEACFSSSFCPVCSTKYTKSVSVSAFQSRASFLVPTISRLATSHTVVLDTSITRRSEKSTAGAQSVTIPGKHRQSYHRICISDAELNDRVNPAESRILKNYRQRAPPCLLRKTRRRDVFRSLEQRYLILIAGYRHVCTRKKVTLSPTTILMFLYFH